MNERQLNIAKYCDGVLTSKEIAVLSNDSHKYVQFVSLKFDLPRRKKGSSFGKMNGSYKTGRKIDRDGYVLVSAPAGHPRARTRKDRQTGVIYEHRLAVESRIGRYLLPSEIVDHIDGLRLHNEPGNLRLFASNAEHLKATIAGQIPKWSKEGLSRMNSTRHQKSTSEPVNNYNSMKKRGDSRLIQILRAALSLGLDSPYLLGSSHHLKKAGISDLSDSSLKRALGDLYQRYA